MALIRQASSRAIAADAVRLDLGDLARQGESLVRDAERRAREIIAAAEAERQKLVSSGAEEGRKQGYAKGLEEGRAAGDKAGRQAALAETRERLAALEAAWTQALSSFDQTRDQILLEARTDVLRLACEIGRRVTKRAVTLDEAAVVDQLQAVLAVLTRPTRLVIHVHPDDAPLVRDALPELARRYAVASHVELAESATISRGSVHAAMPGGGSIDATIETQLDRIVAALLPGVANEQDPAP